MEIILYLSLREARLRWCGHVNHVTVKEDMKLVGVREKDAEDRVRWRQMIRCDDP